MVKISTELSSSTWVSTTATEDDRQDRGKKRQDKDKDREEIIGNKREKMGINIKHSIAYMETSTVTFCDFAYSILRCHGLMGDRLCHWKKRKKRFLQTWVFHDQLNLKDSVFLGRP